MHLLVHINVHILCKVCHVKSHYFIEPKDMCEASEHTSPLLQICDLLINFLVSPCFPYSHGCLMFSFPSLVIYGCYNK